MLDVETRVPELLILGGKRLAFGFAVSPGVAGNFSTATLQNPAGSANIITLHEIALSGVAQDISTGLTLLFPGSFGTASYADGRAGVGVSTVANVRFGDLAAVAPDQYRLRNQTAVLTIYSPSSGIAVIPPGTSYAVTGRGLNIGIVAGFVWTERVAEPSELIA